MTSELGHSGVKGMKWGVRRADKKFERKANSLKNVVAIHNKAAADFNKLDLDRINNKPQYKDKDFKQPSALRTKYYAEHQAAFAKRLEDAATGLGTNRSGTRKYTIVMEDNGDWEVATESVRHADSETTRVKVTYDALGHIVSVAMAEGSMAQSVSTDGPSLTHFGVKGMKWGVRKQRQLDTANRVATGKASTFEKVRFTLNTPVHELIRNGANVKKIAKGKAFLLQGQKDRFESGTSTKRDKVDLALSKLNTSLLDVARGR